MYDDIATVTGSVLLKLQHYFIAAIDADSNVRVVLLTHLFYYPICFR